MGRAYSDLAFTPAVRQVQSRQGSRSAYAPLDDTDDRRDRLTARETEFIEARDSFYQATVSETGWPYVQFRGGPRGFLKVIDDRTIGFADFRGNRQYISVGNLAGNDRIAIILMDYVNRQRLKLLGRVRIVEEADDPSLVARLELPAYRARVERAFLIHIEAYDWNCPQHITPRWTEEEARQLLASSVLQDPQPLGNGPLQLRITGVRQLTPRIRAYEIATEDGRELPAFAAGAHLDIPVKLASGALSSRRYSIASDPRRRDRYEIAVLREDGGSGGSIAVHANLTVGSRLRCNPPGNDFRLHDDPSPVVLIAGGIGITPIHAMAHSLRAAGRSFTLHYAFRSATEAAYLRELRVLLGEDLRCHDASHGERLEPSRIIGGAPPAAHVYVCGPASLISTVVEAAQAHDWEPQRVHYERFHPEPRRDDRSVRVRLQRSRAEIDVPADLSILDALEQAGVAASAGCRNGSCGTCATKVLAGQPDHRDSVLTEDQRVGERLMCVCVSRAHSPDITLDI